MDFTNLPGGIVPWASGGGLVILLGLILIIAAFARGPKEKKHSPLAKAAAGGPLSQATKPAADPSGVERSPPPASAPAAAKSTLVQAWPAPSAPTAAAAPARLAAGAIAVGDADAWMHLGSLQPVDTSNGALRVVGSIRSKATVPPTPGAKYRLELIVRAVKDPTNGAPLNFCAGPIAIDKLGAMVTWWAPQEPITVAEGRRNVIVDMTVPAGVETVCAGLNGPYEIDQNPIADGLIELESARLVAV